VSERDDTEEATLQAYRRLLERAAAALAEATAAQREADPPLDPPPCP
jgi:hypothetical protein